MLFACFAESSNRAKVFYFHEDGLANEITTENDWQVKLVKINKNIRQVTFNLPLGFLKRDDEFYGRMTNRTIIVATDNVSGPDALVIFVPYSYI